MYGSLCMFTAAVFSWSIEKVLGVFWVSAVDANFMLCSKLRIIPIHKIGIYIIFILFSFVLFININLTTYLTTYPTINVTTYLTTYDTTLRQVSIQVSNH